MENGETGSKNMAGISLEQVLQLHGRYLKSRLEWMFGRPPSILSPKSLTLSAEDYFLVNRDGQLFEVTIFNGICIQHIPGVSLTSLSEDQDQAGEDSRQMRISTD